MHYSSWSIVHCCLYYYFVFSGNDWRYCRSIRVVHHLHHHHGCRYSSLRQVSRKTTINYIIIHVFHYFARSWFFPLRDKFAQTRSLNTRRPTRSQNLSMGQNTGPMFYYLTQLAVWLLWYTTVVSSIASYLWHARASISVETRPGIILSLSRLPAAYFLSLPFLSLPFPFLPPLTPFSIPFFPSPFPNSVRGLVSAVSSPSGIRVIFLGR